MLQNPKQPRTVFSMSQVFSQNSNSAKSRRAFTLLELIVAVVLLAVLTVVAVPTYFSLSKQASDSSLGGAIAGLAEEAQSLASGAAIPSGANITSAANDINKLPGNVAISLLSSTSASPNASTTYGAISYDNTDSASQVGWAAVNQNGDCVMALSTGGPTVYWNYGALGLNCTGTVALAGRSQAAPSYYGGAGTIAATYTLSGYNIANVTSNALAADANSVWAVDKSTGKLLQISAATGSVVHSTLLAAGFVAGGIAADGNDVWVQSAGGSALLYKLTAADSLVGSYGEAPGGSGVVSDGTHVWAVCGQYSNMYVFNASDGSVSSSTAVISMSATASAVSVLSGQIFVAAESTGQVQPFTGTSTAGTAWLAGSSASAPDGIYFDGTHVWVSQSGTNSLVEYSTTGVAVHSFSLSGAPAGVVGDGTYVWVVANPGQSTGTVTQIKLSDNSTTTYTATTLGYNPSYVAYSSGYAWIGGYDGTSKSYLTKING